MFNFKTLKVTDDLSVQVIPNKDHEFIMTTNDVAHGYDCSTDGIKKARQRHSDELVEGKHFYSERDKMSLSGNLQTQKIYWTKRGIVRLGFFLTSNRAKLFRDWAEDLIVSGGRRELKLRDDERELLDLLDRYLIPGDQGRVAADLGVGRKTVNSVKCGRTRSARIMARLCQVALENKRTDRKHIQGYRPVFVQGVLSELGGDHV